MQRISKSVLAVAAFLLLGCVAKAAKATAAPSAPCSLLAPADINSATGGNYGPPESSRAPKPFASSGPGTDCNYKSGRDGLQFRIYFDPSTDGAKTLFNELKGFFPKKNAPPGLGDDAYFDDDNGLHVLKGNVRFYLIGSPTNAQLQTIATGLAKRIN